MQSFPAGVANPRSRVLGPFTQRRKQPLHVREPRLELLVFSSKHLGSRLAGMGVKDASRIDPAADLAGGPFAITLRDELATSITRYRRSLRLTLTFLVRHRLQQPW